MIMEHSIPGKNEELMVYNPETMDLKALEMEKGFSYEGYSVVRRELFAHRMDPAVTIRYNSVTFNNACINGLKDAVYIELMVNVESEKMVIRKCDEDTKDALRWCIPKKDVRKSRVMKNEIFSPMLYEKMGWNPKCRYKILGYKIKYQDILLYIFDLAETEIYLDRKELAKVIGEDGTETQRPLTPEEIKMTKRPYYPEGWKESFGLPVEEHEKALDINYIDGFAVFRKGDQ